MKNANPVKAAGPLRIRNRSQSARMMRSLLLMMVLVLVSGACVHESGYFEFICRYCDEEVEIDGRLDESCWEGARWLHLMDNRSGEEIDEKAYRSFAKTFHDRERLYIAFINHDRNIFSSFTRRDDHLWEEEVVEVFIDTDTDPNTYVELEVAPTGVLFDSYIVDTADIDLVETPKYTLEGWKCAVSVEGTVNDPSDEDLRWTVEMSMPLASLKADYRPADLADEVWRINFYRIDRDEDGPGYYAWSPTYQRFHAPSYFGKMRFE